MNPFAKHFSTIKASDLVLLDADGFVVEGGAQLPVNEAGFLIHSEIHKARPDVVAAAHTHGIHGKTWSSFGKPIEMLTQGEYPSWTFIELFMLTRSMKMHATSLADWAFTKTTAALFCPQRRDRRLQRRWAQITSHVSCKTMGKLPPRHWCSYLALGSSG